ncbi:hypothetical protein [Stackebrandtia soli]
MDRTRSFVKRHALRLGLIVWAGWILAVIVMITVDPATADGSP